MNLRCLIKITALLPVVVNALEASPLAEIKALHSFTNWGNADIAVVLQDTNGICKGFWFNKDDAGYQSNLSMLLAAYQANTKVILHGHGELSARWQGSGTHYCKLDSVTYSR